MDNELEIIIEEISEIMDQKASYEETATKFTEKIRVAEEYLQSGYNDENPTLIVQSKAAKLDFHKILYHLNMKATTADKHLKDLMKKQSNLLADAVQMVVKM